jgi:hypothetical protein
MSSTRRESTENFNTEERHDTMRPSHPSPAEDSLQQEMDALSLERTLADFEIANARVLDLTKRLVESDHLIAELQGELSTVRAELRELEARYEAMRSSQAFRLASRIWALRNALRG